MLTNQTEQNSGNPELETLMTCSKSNYGKSSFECFMADGSLATSEQETWLSQSTQRDLVAELLADKRSEHTRSAYKKDLQDFFQVVAQSEATPVLVAEFLGLNRFAAISLVLRYKAALIEKGLKEATVNRRLAAIKSLVNYARKIGKCDFSLEDIRPEKSKAYRDTSGVSADVFKQVLNQCDRATIKGKRDYALLHLLWSNALRRNEAVTLNIKEFDPDARTLSILGKGTGSQREIISLSRTTTDALCDWLNERKCSDPNAPLFCSVSKNQTGHRLTGEAMRQIVEQTCKAAGVSKKMSPHRIRHGSITHALDQTRDVRKVQQLSRHANLDTLMIYDDNRTNFQGKVSELLSDSLQ